MKHRIAWVWVAAGGWAGWAIGCSLILGNDSDPITQKPDAGDADTHDSPFVPDGSPDSPVDAGQQLDGTIADSSVPDGDVPDGNNPDAGDGSLCPSGCLVGTRETCGDGGARQCTTTCAWTPCFEGPLPDGPSCSGSLSCGTQSCCESLIVGGGVFSMGRSADAGDSFNNSPATYTDAEVPEHRVTVDPFALDTFEVTVGRMRNYLAQRKDSPPKRDGGAHPRIVGSGWQSSWDPFYESNAKLISTLETCNASLRASDASAEVTSPIRCVSWYEAFAFCIWDGGRLPSEAEWEFAAAGGPRENRYPWGGAAGTGTPSCTLGRFRCGDAAADVEVVGVGTYPDGKAYFGHLDLSGNVAEWVLDAFGPYTADSVVNPAWLPDGGSAPRVARGGSYKSTASDIRAASRYPFPESAARADVGFRCARDL